MLPLDGVDGALDNVCRRVDGALDNVCLQEVHELGPHQGNLLVGVTVEHFAHLGPHLFRRHGDGSLDGVRHSSYFSSVVEKRVIKRHFSAPADLLYSGC